MAERPSSSLVLLEGVRVRYRIVEDRVTSFKEFVLTKLRSKGVVREVCALDGVDLEVARGQMLGIVGANGAGKTTLLKVIAGVSTPSEGRVRTVGRVVPLLGVGAGFQPDLTGRENAYLAMTMLGIRRRRAAELFDDVVEFSELGGVIDRPVRQYSAGMVARLGFAVGTAERADVLLLDEVLAVGDERFQEKCLERIGEACAAGTTVLLVSHSAPAISHCLRAVWLYEGRICADGQPGEVLADYRRGERGTSASFINLPREEPASGSGEEAPSRIEELGDADLVTALRWRCGDSGSPFHAYRVFSELRSFGHRLDSDFDRVLEIGPSSSKLMLYCFALAGSTRVASIGEGRTVTKEELDLLRSYLGPVCAAKWWRHSADVYDGGLLEAADCWNDVDPEHRGAIVERLPDLGSGRIPVADGAFTFVCSAGALAHTADPEVTIRETARVLAPGGGCVHEIVFGALTDEDPLAAFRYSEDEWRRRSSDDHHSGDLPGAHPELANSHRWLVSDVVAAMDRAGFEEIRVEPVIRIRREAIDRDLLAEPFSSRDMEDLAILVAHVYGRRARDESVPRDDPRE